MASVDYFLKIDGVEGESADEKHSGQIELISWSWGESNVGTHASGGGGGAGKVSMEDFSCSMYASKATPILMLYCASGQHIPSVTLTCRKAGGEQQEFLIVKFSECHISAYATSGSTGDVVPTDTISINFAKIEFEYKPQLPDGTLGSAVTAGWDLKKNKKV